jgi:hypothetical protein
MSQMRLFDMAHYAEMLERMEHKVDCLNRKLDALLAIKADDQPTLLAMVAAGPTLEVVPNEDEAMPVLTQSQYDAMTGPDRLDRLAKAKCPQCNRRAYSEPAVESEFGYRTMEDGKVIVQSWCRECRKLEQATSPRKRAKATLWSKMDAQACAFAKAYTQARNEMMQYKVKLDNESLAPSVRAHLVIRYEAKRIEQAKHKSEYNKRVAVLQASLTN